MQITWLDNETGNSGAVAVADGLTVSEFFRNQKRGSRPEDYKIRVNGQAVEAGHTLRSGDKVSVTPVRIQGA